MSLTYGFLGTPHPSQRRRDALIRAVIEDLADRLRDEAAVRRDVADRLSATAGFPSMTILNVPRSQAEELMQRQVARADELVALGLQSQSETDYQAWVELTERWRRIGLEVLAKIYGEDSKQQNEFAHAANVPIAIGGTPWRIEQDRSIDRTRSRASVLTALIEQLELVDEPFVPRLGSEHAEPGKAASMGILVVHGRDEAARESVARTLEKAGREVVILHEQANKGRTLIEKFEQHAAEAGFAVILLTGDDVGGRSDKELQPRARQNVVFEMGFFYALLGRDHVAVLYRRGVEKPSDIDGLVYIELDEAGAWKHALLAEI
jgi:hypothetical protein